MEHSMPAKNLFFSIFVISSFMAIPTGLCYFYECLNEIAKPPYSISEFIFTPENSNFTSVLAAYGRNKRFLSPTAKKPFAIIAANDSSHVQATVLCSKWYYLQVRIRSGGHDYEGLSYFSTEFVNHSFLSNLPFVILDMFNMRSIDIDMGNQTAWVQSGASLGELYYRIAEKSNVHGFPAGVCTTLGVGGHFSGGGYGNMMRKYGLSVDNIVDALIVTNTGEIWDRQQMGEDLFWAIRGGGGASFGVILAWKIKLVPVPEKVTVLMVSRTLEEGATDLVWKWQHIAVNVLDPELFLRLVIQTVNGTQAGNKTIEVTFIGMYLGSAKQLVDLLNKTFPELGVQDKDCTERRWIESVLDWYGLPKGTPLEVMLDRTPHPAIYHKHKSDYVKNPIPKEGLESIWKVMIQLGVDLLMQWNPYGGKMSEIPSNATAFPHRKGYLFLIQYIAHWNESGKEIEELHLNATRTLFQALTPYVTENPREAFLNYRDIDIGSIVSYSRYIGFYPPPCYPYWYDLAKEYGVKYFSTNFDRLVNVKTTYDSMNFFSYEQSIPLNYTYLYGRH